MTRSQALRFFKWIAMIGIYGGLLVPLMFIPTVIFPFVFSKLIYFQVLVGLTFPAYLALAWMEPKYRPKSHLLYFAILSYFGALALSVIFAADPLRAWWGNQERMNGLFTLLHFLVWMTMAVGVLQSWKDWQKLLVYEVVLSGIMALVAIMQKLNPNLLMFPAGPRVGGLVDNPIYMAAYQIFNFFFLALLFWKIPEKNWRWFFAFIFGLDLIAFILAQSRGALVGLAAGLVCFAIYIGIFSKNKRLRLSVFGAIAVMFLAYGGLFLARNTTLVAETPFARLVSFNSGVDTRFIAWKIAWEGFLERPLTGWGLDNFHILFNKKYNPISLRYSAYETWFDRAHNTVLDVLSMTGLVGFLTFMSIFVVIFLSTFKAYKKGWIDLPIAAILFSLPIAYFVQNLFVFDHPAGFSMSFLLYALIIAATKGEFVGEVEKTEHKQEETFAAPWTAFVVIQLLMLALVWRTSVLPFKASALSIKANSYMNVNPQLGFQYAQQASETPTMYLDEQTFLLSRNIIALNQNGVFAKLPNWKDLYSLAKKISLEEIGRHPDNTHPNFIFARLSQEMIQLMPEEAAVSEKYYLAAIQTSPERQQLHYGLARLYLQTGHTDQAVQIFNNVIAFDPDYGEGYWNLGLTQTYDLHNIQAGAENMRKAMSVPFPYQMTNPRELVALIEAYAYLDDDQAIKRMIEQLDQSDKLVRGNATVFAQIEFVLVAKGKTDLAKQLMDKATSIDPATPEAYKQLLQSQNAGSASTAVPAAVSSSTSTKDSGSGPRR